MLFAHSDTATGFPGEAAPLGHQWFVSTIVFHIVALSLLSAPADVRQPQRDGVNASEKLALWWTHYLLVRHAYLIMRISTASSV
eukprot:9416-Heterococcus_DN1.PRE.1